MAASRSGTATPTWSIASNRPCTPVLTSLTPPLYERPGRPRRPRRVAEVTSAARVNRPVIVGVRARSAPRAEYRSRMSRALVGDTAAVAAPVGVADRLSAAVGERRRTVLLLAIYAAVHAGTTLAVALAKYTGHLSWTRAFAPWDGPYYRAIAEHGYPAFIPDVTRDDLASGAFFPLYPMLVRGVSEVTALPVVAAGIVLNLLLGAASVLLVYAAARTALPELTAFPA